MIRATLDVHVLVSGFPASSGAPAELVERWLRREFELVVSEHILTEAADAWKQPYWAARYTTEQVLQTLDLLRERAAVVAPVTTVHGVGEDEEDDLVLATAVAGSVEFLVTGDKYLQALGSFPKPDTTSAQPGGMIAIVTPRRFVELLSIGVEDAGVSPAP